MSKKYLLLLILLASSFMLFFPRNSRALVNHVVISQVQITGVTATDEFVELFNPTENPISLTGFRLTKKVTGSGTESTLVASISGTIASNSYFLIKHPTGYTGSAVADSEYSTSASVTASNTVLLYSDAPVTILDKVGFGTPFESETLPFPTNPASGQSIRRINNQDTDNNSLDFELLTVSSPRNSSFAQASTSPSASATPTSVPTTSPIETPVYTPSPANTPIQTTYPSSSPTLIPTETTNPSPTVLPTYTPTSTSSPIPKPKSNHGHYFGHKVKDFISTCRRFVHDSFTSLHEDSHNNSKKWPSPKHPIRFNSHNH